MPRLSEESLNMVKRMNKRERDLLGSTIKHIREQGVEMLPGEWVDVDTLQIALEACGFKKGKIGDNGCWYRNITSNVCGYIAEMEAVDPADGRTYTIIVECDAIGVMVKAVD